MWEALDRASARLVCAAEGLDTATGDHELIFSIKAAIARDQWKRIRANSERARRSAVERGVHVGQCPAGYSRPQKGLPLTPNEFAPKVREAFEARASGASWSETAKCLEGVPTSRGSTVWSLKATSKLIASPTYLGVARSGEFRNEKAHEAIVGRGLWEKANAQGREGHPPPHPGTGAPAALAGVVRCGTCRHAMTRNWSERNGRKSSSSISAGTPGYVPRAGLDRA